MPDRIFQSARYKKLKESGWDVLDHSSYSPDIAPTNYYLFRSMEHSLRMNNNLTLHPNGNPCFVDQLHDEL